MCNLQRISKQCLDNSLTLHMIESLRFTFLVIWAICLSQVRSEVSMTPRCLCRCTLSMMVKSIITGLANNCALLKIKSLLFCGLNFTFQICAQLEILVRSLLRMLVVSKVVSAVASKVVSSA